MKVIFRVCKIIFIVLIMVGIAYANKDRNLVGTLVPKRLDNIL